MRVLIDSNKLDAAEKDLGMKVYQLLTPLTRYRLVRDGEPFAIDNGAFTGLNITAFLALLRREWGNRHKCMFVAVPDVVADAQLTRDFFDFWKPRLSGWPLAYVIQDGQETVPVPWDDITAIFVGGSTKFKLGPIAEVLILEAKRRGKHVHIGRVNSPERFKWFESLGADTCDGTGLARYSHMREKIGKRHDQRGIFA